jgi:hypothetical protein
MEVKVKLYLCLIIKPYAIKTYDIRRYSSTFLDFSHFTEERAPGTHCIRSWMGPKTGLDAMKR